MPQVAKIFKTIIFLLILLITLHPSFVNSASQSSVSKQYNVQFEKKMTCIFKTSNQNQDIFQAGLTKDGNFFFEEPFPLNKKFSTVSQKTLFVKKGWWGNYELEIINRRNKKSKLIFNFENKTSELTNEKGKFKSKDCL